MVVAQLGQLFKMSDIIHPDRSKQDFAVVQASHVQGTQSINGGEPGAIEWLARYVATSATILH